MFVLVSEFKMIGMLLNIVHGQVKKKLTKTYRRFPNHSTLINYRKIPKISPGAYIFQRPFLRGLFSEGLVYGVKFVFQNRLG